MTHSRVGDPANWDQRLAVLAERYGTPGAVLGILHDGDIVESAHGVLNAVTGVATTTDSLFQIGSITKMWTATLVMQLVDDGDLSLDAPIIDVLPELVLATPKLTKQVTLRQLLSHTSGIDGDVFLDTGRGDDCLECYVERLADIPQNHPPGATMSYSNSGFNIVGRVIERLTGQTWNAALRDRLVHPLALTHNVTLPESVLRFRSAIGHAGGTGHPVRPAPVWDLPRSNGPAGGICCTVRDVLTFARPHCADGRTADGTQLLSVASASAMTERQAELPEPCPAGRRMGLGWILDEWDGHRLIAHDGGPSASPLSCG